MSYQTPETEESLTGSDNFMTPDSTFLSASENEDDIVSDDDLFIEGLLISKIIINFVE
jgi:hypothetical protein